jgi:DNA polymerase elongation subunit (family B)
MNWLKDQSITETKGVFDDVTATVNGFTFVFGLGGIHGSVENEVIEATNTCVIESVDVSSMYPNIAIKNRFYPEHLGEVFCDIYQHLYEQRKQYAKGTAENAMLKLALNGTFGDSNNQFSVFYDPLLTMRITLTGQLVLCVLAERLMKIPTVRIIMANTDGLEYTIHPDYVEQAKGVCKEWEALTGLELERARYRRMFILNVNNYLAEYEE